MTDTWELVGSIRKSLTTIRDNYDEALEPVKRATGSPVKSSKQAPLPVSAHILDVRREAHEDLHFWARFIMGEVKNIDGGNLAAKVDGGSVDAMARFIATWADRLATEFPEDALNCSTEMAKHASALHGMVHELGTRRFPIGPCTEHATSPLGERIPCPGQMRAVLRRDGDTMPSEIQCSEDTEHGWGASEWMSLGRRLMGEASA